MYITFSLKRLLSFAAVIGCILFFLFSAMRVSVNAEGRTVVPVIMYHQISESEELLGKYVVSPDEFEQDLIYLRDNGYTAMLFSEIAEYQRQGKVLPSKPVVITFDDGQECLYAYAYPLLAKYNMKAVFNIVGEFVDRYSEIEDHNLAYSCLNWNEVHMLAQSGIIEIGNHTYDMHAGSGSRIGCGRMSDETAEDYRAALTGDVGYMQLLIEERAGIEAVTFAYPYGIMSEESRGILVSLGFDVLLTCKEKLNYPDEENWLLDVGRYNRPHGISSEEFFEGTMGLKK